MCFYSDIDGVLESANKTEYGLASGVFTNDLSKVMDFVTVSYHPYTHKDAYVSTLKRVAR